jgi:tetratricopeptide (TPR) repeat protein
VRLFVSYTGADTAWAEWIAWQLEQAGHQTIVGAWDFRPGENFVLQMRRALDATERTVAVVSAAYLESVYTSDEWTAAFIHDRPDKTSLVLVRVEDVVLPRLLRPWIYIDLVGLDTEKAAAALLAGVEPGRRKPNQPPPFPQPHFPGNSARVSNLPPRNPSFTGRDELLEQLRVQLSTEQPTAVVAAHGLGGVGKTQLALEYAHRHGDQYWLRWWVAAENPLTVTGALSQLASRLGLMREPEVGSDQESMVAAVREYLAGEGGWLLVFDNAEEPADLIPLLPANDKGHVIITSRNPRWSEVAHRLKVDVLSKEAAHAFLLQRTGAPDQPEVDQLAQELGFLPLGLAQAAAYVEQTPGLTVTDYLDRYRQAHDRLLASGQPIMYPATVATTWLLNFDRVALIAPAAIQLLYLFAFLGPEPIPLSLLFQGEQHDWLPSELSSLSMDPLALDAALSALHRYSLISPARNGIQVHRLVQAVTRDRLNKAQAQIWAERAIRLVWTAFPDPMGPRHSTDLSQAYYLLPHVFATSNHGRLAPERASSMLNQVGMYLFSLGVHVAARGCLIQAVKLAEAAGANRVAAMALENLAQVLIFTDELDAAQKVLERSLKIEETTQDSEDTHELGRLITQSMILSARGDLHAAQRLLERFIQECEATRGSDDHLVAGALALLGKNLAEQEDLPAARRVLERAVRILDAAAMPDHYYIIMVMEIFGPVLMRLNDLPAATSAFERALTSTQAVHEPEDRSVADALIKFGVALHYLDSSSVGRDHVKRGVAMYRKALGADHPDTQEMQSLLEGLPPG